MVRPVPFNLLEWRGCWFSQISWGFRLILGTDAICQYHPPALRGLPRRRGLWQNALRIVLAIRCMRSDGRK